MISSYRFSQSYNTQSILQDATRSLFAFLRTLALLLLAGAVLAVVFAVLVAFWLPLAQIAGGLAIVGAFGWATYPRPKVVAK